MSERSWRDIARPIIARVLLETAGQEEKAIKKALRDAYPFGERTMWPYKVWLSEIAIQRGTRKTIQPPPHKFRALEAAGQGSLEL